MIRYLTLFTVAAAFFCTAMADPYEHPVRVVSGTKLDLTPLFNWKKGRRGGAGGASKARPFPAWGSVQGSVAKASGLGWEVEGSFEGADGKMHRGKVLLKNPPVAELAEHQRLQAQLEQAQAQFERMRAERNMTGAGGAERRGPPGGFRGRGGRRGGGGDLEMQREAEKRLESVVQENVVNSGSEMADLAALRLQINKLQQQLARTSGRDGKFRVDVIAFRNGQVWNSMPVFDMGYVVK